MKKLNLVFSVLLSIIWSCNDQEPELEAGYKSFLEQFKEVDLPYELNPTQEDVFGKITVEDQAKYLAKPENLKKEDFKEMAEYTDYYFVSRPVRTSKFNAIVYARFEMGSTYYFLCTYDNNANLISNIDFAAYELIGAGPQAGQEYNTKGKISKDLKVTVTSAEEELNYQINEDGKIDES